MEKCNVNADCDQCGTADVACVETESTRFSRTPEVVHYCEYCMHTYRADATSKMLANMFNVLERKILTKFTER